MKEANNDTNCVKYCVILYNFMLGVFIYFHKKFTGINRTQERFLWSIFACTHYCCESKINMSGKKTKSERGIKRSIKLHKVRAYSQDIRAFDRNKQSNYPENINLKNRTCGFIMAVS